MKHIVLTTALALLTLSSQAAWEDAPTPAATPVVSPLTFADSWTKQCQDYPSTGEAADAAKKQACWNYLTGVLDAIKLEAPTLDCLDRVVTIANRIPVIANIVSERAKKAPMLTYTAFLVRSAVQDQLPKNCKLKGKSGPTT